MRVSTLGAALLTWSALVVLACGERVPSTYPTWRATHRVLAAEPSYRVGVQQGSPPDGTLVVGTLVEVIADEGSAVRLRFEDGSEVSASRSAVEVLPSPPQSR